MNEDIKILYVEDDQTFDQRMKGWNYIISCFFFHESLLPRVHQKRDEIEAQRDEIEAQRDMVQTQKDHIEEIHHEVSQSIDGQTFQDGDFIGADRVRKGGTGRHQHGLNEGRVIYGKNKHFQGGRRIIVHQDDR